MHRYFNQVRTLAIRTILLAYTTHKKSVQLPLGELVRALAFGGAAEARAFCEHFGLDVGDEMVLLHRAAFMTPEGALPPRRSAIIEEKRLISVGEVVNGGPLPPITAHVPASSFDVNGRYRTTLPVAMTTRPPPVEDALPGATATGSTLESSASVAADTETRLLAASIPSNAIKEFARELCLEVIQDMCRDVAVATVVNTKAIISSVFGIVSSVLEEVVATEIRLHGGHPPSCPIPSHCFYPEFPPVDWNSEERLADIEGAVSALWLPAVVAEPCDSWTAACDAVWSYVGMVTGADGDDDNDEASITLISRLHLHERRTLASVDEPLAHELRPTRVLTLTMTYLVRHLMHRGVDGHTEWYDFLWNRTRGIRKDITQQDLCSVESAALVEKCARFHIHCAARLCEEEMMTFDPKINDENLTKTLQTLKQMYDDLESDGKTRCAGEAEFRAYDILLNLNEGDKLRQVSHYRTELRMSDEVKFAVKAFSALNSNNLRLLNLALEQERRKLDARELRLREEAEADTREKVAEDVREEIEASVVAEEVAGVAVDEMREVALLLQEQQRSLVAAVLTSELLDDMVTTECGATCRDVYATDVEDVQLFLAEQKRKVERLRLARYFRKWVNAYAGRLRLRGSMLAFPSAPPMVSAAQQFARLHPGGATKRARVGEESPLVLERRQKYASQALSLHGYIHLLQQELAWKPLNIPHLIAPHLTKRRSRWLHLLLEGGDIELYSWTSNNGRRRLEFASQQSTVTTRWHLVLYSVDVEQNARRRLGCASMLSMSGRKYLTGPESERIWVTASEITTTCFRRDLMYDYLSYRSFAPMPERAIGLPPGKQTWRPPLTAAVVSLALELGPLVRWTAGYHGTLRARDRSAVVCCRPGALDAFRPPVTWTEASCRQYRADAVTLNDTVATATQTHREERVDASALQPAPPGSTARKVDVTFRDKDPLRTVAMTTRDRLAARLSSEKSESDAFEKYLASALNASAEGAGIASPDYGAETPPGGGEVKRSSSSALATPARGKSPRLSSSGADASPRDAAARGAIYGGDLNSSIGELRESVILSKAESVRDELKLRMLL
ncbi:PREDICTED: germinal-center associated nuclear protein-like [Priapulus caudatus]|uniref:Germinal-center associated nuclear protein-like n=1 Tax=Priapulus caudatus TaxID=37621 RepID=A0ABM1EKQ1_PRICU|nr:PREDICTED: germinal-center associated nuclear protein-like [Priapulus caudatus]